MPKSKIMSTAQLDIKLNVFTCFPTRRKCQQFLQKRVTSFIRYYTEYILLIVLVRAFIAPPEIE